MLRVDSYRTLRALSIPARPEGFWSEELRSSLAYGLAYGIGSYAGVIVTFLVALAIALSLYMLSRRTKVTRQRQQRVDRRSRRDLGDTDAAVEAGGSMSAMLLAASASLSWIDGGAVWRIVVMGLAAGAGPPPHRASIER
jgi:hypothetical protein